MNNKQIKRMEDINKLIELIGSTDRCFFNSSNGLSKFISLKTTVRFLDGYTQKEVIIREEGRRLVNFSQGGTLAGLIRDFKHYIITGKHSDGKHGYGGLYATCWGYTLSGQSKIIDFAKEIGYISKDALDFKEYAVKCYESGIYGCGLKSALIKEGLIKEVEGVN